MKAPVCILTLLCALNLSAQLGCTVHPDIPVWRSNVISAAASTTSSNHAWVLNQQAMELAAAGVYQRLYSIMPLAGDDYNAARVALKMPSGVSVLLGNNNVDAADYTPSSGLTGNGTDECFTTALNPRTLGWSTNSLCMFQSLFTSQTAGTTRFSFGISDGASQTTTIGFLNGGTIETVTIGYGASLYQYPLVQLSGSLSNSTTGFFGGNVLSPPLSVPSASIASQALPRYNSASLQGLASDGTYGYATYTDNIVKYQLSDLAPVLTNTACLPSGTTNYSHAGDGCVWNNKLLVPIETITGSGVTAGVSNAAIATYNLSTLALESVFSLTNIMPNGVGAGACIVGKDALGVNTLFMLSGYMYYQTNIYLFDPDTFAHRATVKLRVPFGTGTEIVVQGIEYTNGLLLLNEGGSSAFDARLFAVNVTNWQVDNLTYIAEANITESEGLDIQGTNLIWGANVSTAMRGLLFPITLSSWAKQHSQQVYLDGAIRGMPVVATNGYANNSFAVLAGNNGSLAAFSDRRIGQTFVGQGLYPEQLYPLARAGIRADIFLGRR